jgi:hypothetical protein
MAAHTFVTYRPAARIQMRWVTARPDNHMATAVAR